MYFSIIHFHLALRLCFVIRTRSLATAEIARDADDVDFSVDDVHEVKSKLYLHPMHTPPKQTVLTNCKTAIQGHSRSSVVVSIILALNSDLTSIFKCS